MAKRIIDYISGRSVQATPEEIDSVQVFSRQLVEDYGYAIDSFYLLYLFSHAITKRQFFNKILMDTTLPNIGDRWRELLLPITRNATERERVKQKRRDAFLRKWEIQREFETIKKTLV